MLPQSRRPSTSYRDSSQNGLTDIVLDAMGSDKAPEPEVRGAILACRELSVRVHLVGPRELLCAALEEHLRGERLPIEIVHATERIGMDEKAAVAVRNKRDSSMRVGLKLIRERLAAGFLTAGNTGAAMATAKMVLGALPGVDRPCFDSNPAYLFRFTMRPARCRSKCRVQTSQSGAICGDGRDVLPQRVEDRAASRRPAFDWRRREQGQ